VTEARIEYAVGIRWPEGTDTEAYDYLMALPDWEPEKHELFAHMLLLAVRKEWEAAERLRGLKHEREARERRRAERAAAKLASQTSGNEEGRS
jgi:hypothetical protein